MTKLTNEELLAAVLGPDGEFQGDFARTHRAEILKRMAEGTAGEASPLEVALRKIADNYGGCHCDHTDADCCEKAGEFCPHCISEIALLTIPSGSASTAGSRPRCSNYSPQFGQCVYNDGHNGRHLYAQPAEG